MDPSKALNFQTFPNLPHQNGQHIGTMPGHPGQMHSRAGSQSMVIIFIHANPLFKTYLMISIRSLVPIGSLVRTAKGDKAQFIPQPLNMTILQTTHRKKINIDVAILMDNLLVEILFTVDLSMTIQQTVPKKTNTVLNIVVLIIQLHMIIMTLVDPLAVEVQEKSKILS